ncbi:MAG: Pls/PosA family non-ribosomal peptide synthetase [Gemmatimonadota bacterium]
MGHPVDALAAPAAGIEAAFGEVLAGVMRVEHVPADRHFFDHLGADSLMMAHFCARVRKRQDLPSVSIKDIYRYPTIRSLAAAVAAPAEAAAASVSAAEPATAPAPEAAPGPDPAGLAKPAGAAAYLCCGALQFLFFLGYCYLVALAAAHSYQWISAGSGLADVYLRSVVFGGAAFLAVCAFPVLAKWVLIGRWKPAQVRIWSLGYFRFWLVKTLVRASPLALLFPGTPLHVLYLRALGAKIGRGAVILSRSFPVCTDLLTVGAGTIICKDSYLLCYRAQAGQIQTGPVTLGRNVFIGEKTVLDIGTAMGDGAQLGHTSALHSGQAVPAGERWHGSPAQRTGIGYLRVTPARCGPLRKAGYCAGVLATLLLLYLPLAVGSIYLLLRVSPPLARVLDPGSGTASSRQFYLDGLALSLIVFGGALICGLLFVASVPRLLNLVIRPGRVYPLFGFHYRVHHAIARITSRKFFNYLFGDSSYIVYYLRWLGYHLSAVEQTGSNFGTEVAHESPFLSSVGRGTMVADGLSIMNAEFSSTSFRVSQVSIGPHNFLGNAIAYPPGGRTGDNCLLATKVMIPLDGEIREGVGLLGSPCFEIPRSVERDGRFDHLATGAELRRRLRAKNWYNLRTMAVFLAARWLHVLLLTLIGMTAVEFYGVAADAATAGFLALSVLISPVYFALTELVIVRFRPLQPKYCSIYDPYFWRHERLWKVPAMDFLHIFDGTPFKNLIWRLFGVRLGKRVFDDGCYLTERTLASIGDGCTLNLGSKIQCHSQEDGTFKSDRSSIGAGATLGVGAMIHYGVAVGEGAVLAADSFLMKGEEMPAHAVWGGNPAREM